MKLHLTLVALLATPIAAFAQTDLVGDATKGEANFKQCQTCHVVADGAGNVLAGKVAKTGPNLYGLFGRTAGTYPDFKYGEDMIAAGAAGLVWDQATFIDYVQDPSGFLKVRLDDKGAKGKMQFKVKNAQIAADLYAYLATFSPPPVAVDPAAPVVPAPAP